MPFFSPLFVAAQSQEVALPGSASGLASPAASEPLSSLLASVGNKSLLLSKVGGLENLGMVGQARAPPWVQRRWAGWVVPALAAREILPRGLGDFWEGTVTTKNLLLA